MTVYYNRCFLFIHSVRCLCETDVLCDCLLQQTQRVRIGDKYNGGKTRLSLGEKNASSKQKKRAEKEKKKGKEMFQAQVKARCFDNFSRAVTLFTVHRKDPWGII